MTFHNSGVPPLVIFTQGCPFSSLLISSGDLSGGFKVVLFLQGMSVVDSGWYNVFHQGVTVEYSEWYYFIRGSQWWIQGGIHEYLLGGRKYYSVSFKKIIQLTIRKFSFLFRVSISLTLILTHSHSFIPSLTQSLSLSFLHSLTHSLTLSFFPPLSLLLSGSYDIKVHIKVGRY